MDLSSVQVHHKQSVTHNIDIEKLMKEDEEEDAKSETILSDDTNRTKPEHIPLTTDVTPTPTPKLADPLSEPVGKPETSDEKNKENEKQKTESKNKNKTDNEIKTVAVIELPWYLKALDPKKMNYEIWYPKLPVLFRGFHAEKELLHAKCLSGYALLAKFSSTSSFGKDLADLWNKQLGIQGYGKLYARLMEQFMKRDYIEECVKSEWKNVSAKAAYNNFYHASRTMWNGTDSDEGLCQQMWKENKDSGSGTTVGENILNILATDPKYKFENLNEDIARTWVCRAFLSILMNSMRRCPDLTYKFRDLRGPRTILPYTEASEEDMMSVVATCTIIYGSDEKRLKELGLSEKIISFLLKHVLFTAAKTKNRRARGFSVEETLHALNKVAYQDTVQDKLCKDKTLLVLYEILTNPQEDDELLQIANLFWTLSFNQKLKDAVKTTIPKLNDHLEELRDKGKISKVRKAAKGALWNLSGNRPKTPSKTVIAKTTIGRPTTGKEQNRENVVVPPPPAALAGGGGLLSYIMVSYDWRHKEVVLPLNQALKKAGYRTWIDVEQMSGSTLDAMADAVEKASVVLICISERYKESPNCRAEAEYAFRLNKPIIPVRTQKGYKPDGWLGMLMGTKLYFNCFEKDQVAEAQERVMCEIARTCREVQAKAVATAATTRTTSPPPSSSTPTLPTILPGTGGDPNAVCMISQSWHENQNKVEETKIQDWDEEKVEKWLKKKKLQHLQKKLGDLDGQQLVQLANIYKKNPQVFLPMLDKMKIDNPQDMLRLTSALESCTET